MCFVSNDGPELRGPLAADTLGELFGEGLTQAYEIVLLAGHWFGVPRTAPFVMIWGFTAAELRVRLGADYEMRALHRRANPPLDPVTH
jgi:hypothetical protein